MFTRAFAFLLLGVATLICGSRPAVAASLKVGAYLVNTEGAFTATAQTYAVPLNLSARTRLVVQAAPQYAMDFGIIPAAELKKWRSGKQVRFLFRLAGTTDSRYITLNEGAYYVVARDLNGGVVTNGFAIKIRRFTAIARDNDVKLAFVSGRAEKGAVGPVNWNGFVFAPPVTNRMWFDGIFSRGLDRKVRWEIVTEAEFQKFASGYAHQALLSGEDPKRLGFEFTATPGRYYFLLINQGPTYSAYAVARELYR
ncbi:hypothetical protein ACXR0O_29010 [Verrucomicrobiota bacterium sgz303538]